MGILDSMAQQSQQPAAEATAQIQPEQAQAAQTGDMGQMYQIVMQNSLQAIANTAEQRIQQKGVIDGTADLVATAMVSNLQAAKQNGKAIPPQVLMQVAKDLTVALLQKLGVPEEQFEEALMDILLRAMEQFGEMSQGIISPEEEQQYVDMLQQVAQAAQQNAGSAPQQPNQAMM